MARKWEVVFHEEFDEEFKVLEPGLQDELLAHAILVRDGSLPMSDLTGTWHL